MTRPQQHKGGRPQLPQGWTSFASTPDGKHTAHWYATSPYPVDALKEEYGQTAQPLCRTVTAATWSELHTEVAAQAELYERLTGAQPNNPVRQSATTAEVPAALRGTRTT
ncbi:hypothetical protein ACWD5R_18500 [Streptomyces sp. NPDC002514]|uniref:hypothetical protein n=1 Tax=Streptomyces sp. NPDC001270 TaxID=3364554 RepID=UPI003699D087